MMRAWIGLFFLVSLGVLTGCPPIKPPPPVPAALSLAEQVSILNQRAQTVPGLKARGGVEIVWKDENGKRRERDADAVLRLLQRPERAQQGLPAADVVLFGRFAGQDVFELGVNDQNHWMAFRVDPKTAYIGRVEASGENGFASAPFRADRVLTVLGITQLYEAQGQHLAMLIKGDQPPINKRTGQPTVPAANEVQVIRLTGRKPIQAPNASYGTLESWAYPAWIERVITIDRRTGHITRIDLYRADGQLEATAALSDYKLAEIEEQTDDGPVRRKSQVQMPTRVQVVYPQEDARVTLAFNQMVISDDLKPESFTMPDFAGQGLRVEGRR